MKRAYSKIQVIIFLVFGISFSSFSQIDIGGNLGVNLANLRGESVMNNSMIIGYNVGVTGTYGFKDIIQSDFGEKLSVSVGLSLNQKGATTDYLFYSDTLQVNIDTVTSIKQLSSYLDIPVTVRYAFGDPRYVRFYVEAGFYIAGLYRLTLDGEVWRDHDQDPKTDRRKYREEYSGFDYGVVGGAGVLVPIGGRRSPWMISGGVRYALGLNNIGQLKKGTIDIPPGQLKDIKTSTITVFAGVVYKLD